MNKLVLYIHGKGGTAEEARHFKPLFSDCDIIGMDYTALFPWQAKEEFSSFFDNNCLNYDSVTLFANSIGAFFSMVALSDKRFERAFFISPIVDMEKLIEDMMAASNVTEAELCQSKAIPTACGETLSWDYLCYVRTHPINWSIPTHILYGENDNLTASETITEFAEKTKASLTIMKNGEHWFHTPEQMVFLDEWIKGEKNAGQLLQ